MKLNSII